MIVKIRALGLRVYLDRYFEHVGGYAEFERSVKNDSREETAQVFNVTRQTIQNWIKIAKEKS